MLITSYQHPTKIERLKKLMFRRRRRRRKTKTKTKDENEDERRKRRRKTKTASIEKEQKERRKLIFQNKSVSSQNKRYKKRRGRCGRLVGHFTLPFLSGQLRAGRTGSVLPWKPSNLQRESPINYHKCPTFDAKRETRNTKHETPAIFSHLIDSPKQMK